MAFDDSRETAAFNLAILYLGRVNTILNSNYVHFRNGDAIGFAINLRQLYRELVPWLVVDEKKSVDDKTPILEAFAELATIPKQRKEKIWEKMEEIEMMMRIRFKHLGMLMPSIHDPRFLFGNKQR